MNAKKIIERLHRGQRVYGTHIASTSPVWPGFVRGVGLDFVFIDTEHVPIDRAQLSWMCRTYDALGLPPIVRIPAPDPYQACMALDAGAAGIVAPYVETVAEAEALRGAVKFRPLKGQRLKDALAGKALDEPLASYLQHRNEARLLILNIESAPAMDNIDALLDVPGVDAVLVGPHDLSCSLNRPEAYADPVQEETINKLIAKARAKQVGVGIHVFYGDLEQETRWLKAGANLVIHGSDVLLFSETLRREVAQLKEVFGDKALIVAGTDEVI